MLTDNAIRTIKDDQYGFEPFARLLADTIRETDDLPFTLGIFGEWGCGKSSLMNMIRDDLGTSPHVKTIAFNPWKYDNKEELWNALIQTILYGIAEEAEKNNKKEVLEKATNLAKTAAWLALKKGMSALTAGVVSGKDLEKIKNSLFAQDKLHYQHINTFEESFEEVVKLYTGDGKLVVFIDDLDRCMPENAITVLESLKLFIGHASCVFVLGMDRHIIEQGIKLRFGDRIEMSGRDYLDKIIQAPFFIPPVPFAKLRESLQVAKTAQYSDTVWKIIEYGLRGNPRRTKRFVNSFFLLNQILKSPEVLNAPGGEPQQPLFGTHEEQHYYLAKLLIFQLVFNRFYTHLELNPEAWSDLEDKIIDADGKPSNNVINAMPEIQKIWDASELFQLFMTQTTLHSSPGGILPPPDEEVVSSLMKAINLVSRSDTQEQKITQQVQAPSGSYTQE
ncbi:MAG: hypothetical protein IH914_10955 [candidate division Zixibacteria bacterium]|nr:hypothetical protein [candidate division Zixibacteria bacterium]